MNNMYRVAITTALRAATARQLIVPKGKWWSLKPQNNRNMFSNPIALPVMMEMSTAMNKFDLYQHHHQHEHGKLCRHFSDDAGSGDEEGGDGGGSKSNQKSKGSLRRHESRDRRIPIDVATSIEYMNSDGKSLLLDLLNQKLTFPFTNKTAFKETYQDYKIWQLFRRNFKGQFSPAKPRINCIEDGFIKSSNPCVICRDRYLVLDYTNVALLEHFISPDTGYVYPNTIICLCMEQYEKLCVATTLAKAHGLIDFEVPQRQYNYKHYYRQLPTGFVE